MSETVQLATILTTDLVGSTRLAMAVGPARADELRDEHFALLREAVELHGGHEAKNTGDGLVIAFASASAAVRCAVLMQQTFERRYRRAEQPLHIRIGMGAGESTVQDGDYFGQPSIEAARLCAQAEVDGILISPTVKLLAGRIDDVEFRSVGELELKGFSEPLEAFAVEWTPLEDEASASVGWPLPPVLRSAPPGAYAGRETERGLIEHSRREVRGGQRRVVLLSGEPGIGKSRLSAWSALGAHGEGFAVLWGSCSEELAAPYEPWLAACSQLVEHAPDAVLEAHVRRHGGELSRLARGLAQRVADVPEPQGSDPETERYLLFAAVSGALEALAAEVPVCIVLDDVHWADAQTVALLKHVARETEGCPLQIVVAYRDSDVGKDHPLAPVLADLRRFEGVERIALRGLEAEDVAHIMVSAAGHELDEDGLLLAGEIATETDGNPFFVGEVLRTLLESGRLVFDDADSRWKVDRSQPLGLPESVKDVVERRVDALGQEVRDVLTPAAVIGRSFDLDLLLRLVAVGEQELLDRLEAAVAASLLEESTERVGRFRFVHALINHTLYESLGATRRARLHREVAEALEELHGSDSGEHVRQLALHWRLATTSVDAEKAARYAMLAGRQALGDLAPAEAAKLFTDALEMLADADTAERCRALIGLGQAQFLIGEPASRETLLEASRIAAQLADGPLAAEAALANSRGFMSIIGAIDEERLAAIAQALALTPEDDLATRARLRSLEAMELAWSTDLERRSACTEEAFRLARESGDAAAVAVVARNVAYADLSPAGLEQRVEAAAELARCASALQDPALEWWALEHERIIAVEQGRMADADAALGRMETLVAGLGQPTMRWQTAFAAAAHELFRGHLASTEELAERALALGQEAGQGDAVFIYGAQLSFVRIEGGRLDEVVPMLEASVAAYPGIAAWSAALAAVYARSGREAQAAEMLADAAGDDFAGVPWDAARMAALAMYAATAVETGSARAAELLYDLIEPWSHLLLASVTTGYGHSRLWLGLLAAVLGRDELADEHLRFACAFHAEQDMPLWTAHSHLGWARALAARGDDAAAREHAASALELARDGGYRLVQDAAEALLAPAASDGR